MRKIITSAVVAILGTLAFQASGQSKMLMVANFSGVYQTDGATIYTNIVSGTNVTSIEKQLPGKPVRITSKDIIRLIGAAFDTNFPAGAQLGFYGGEVVILDSTGTNVIFYPNEVSPPSSDEWGFNFNTGDGVQWGTYSYNTLGDEKDNYTGRCIMQFHLYNNPASIIPTFANSALVTDSFDLTFSGLMNYTYTHNRNHNGNTRVETGACKLVGVGDGDIGDQYGILTGTLITRGVLRVTGK